MSEKHQQISDLAAALHDKRARFEFMGMTNTSGLSGEEFKKHAIAYELARFDYLEARAALERAMPGNKDAALNATYQANMAIVAKLRAERDAQSENL